MDRGWTPVALLMLLEAASTLLQERSFVDIDWSDMNRTIRECFLQTRIHEGDVTALRGSLYQRPLTCLNKLRQFVYHDLSHGRCDQGLR